MTVPSRGTRRKRKPALAEAQNHRCAYCGVRFSDDPASGDYATIDEVIPRARGGAMAWENEVAACHDCNQRRGSGDAYLYFEMLIPPPPR